MKVGDKVPLEDFDIDKHNECARLGLSFRVVNHTGDPYVEVINQDNTLPPMEERELFVRMNRDRMLAVTDFFVMPDYPLDKESLSAVYSYRQMLRDITQLEGFPWDGDKLVPWPEMPNIVKARLKND